MTQPTDSGASPFGCHWCGTEHTGHGWQWTPGHGLHQWQQPTQEQILTRMQSRRQARLATSPHTPEAHPPITEWELEQLTPGGWLRIGEPTDCHDQATAHKAETEAANPGTEYRLVDKTTTWTVEAKR